MHTFPLNLMQGQKKVRAMLVVDVIVNIADL